MVSLMVDIDVTDGAAGGAARVIVAEVPGAPLPAGFTA
jgi:hypothetical protein